MEFGKAAFFTGTGIGATGGGAAKAILVFKAAKMAALAKGLSGAAATTHALATLGGGSIAVGGAGMVGGIQAIALAAAGPATAVVVTACAGYAIYNNREAIRGYLHV